jgi:predicted N-formylglutamate amidohydrolase
MLERSDLLSQADGEPVAVVNPGGRGDVLLICEHASATLPERFGSLGLSPEALRSHIAWDPGALAVCRVMSKSLDAALIYQRFSRLVYDCNRPPEAPGAMPAQSEIFAVPGNLNLTAAERDARTAALYLPFHAKVAEAIAERKRAGRRTVLVTIHSFTPVYLGEMRAVEIGILHDTDSRLADAMLQASADTGLYRIERNQPYGPADGVTHTLKKHGLANGLKNVMIEIRNDLIADEIGQGVVADFMTGLLRESLADL